MLRKETALMLRKGMPLVLLRRADNLQPNDVIRLGSAFWEIRKIEPLPMGKINLTIQYTNYINKTELRELSLCLYVSDMVAVRGAYKEVAA